jgi:1-deoxy-D-xylulose 5-phosphate reductoisomerase
VEAFLEEAIRFVQIPELIESVLSGHSRIREPDLESILAADRQARRESFEWVRRHGGGPLS